MKLKLTGQLSKVDEIFHLKPKTVHLMVALEESGSDHQGQ